MKEEDLEDKECPSDECEISDHSGNIPYVDGDTSCVDEDYDEFRKEAESSSRNMDILECQEEDYEEQYHNAYRNNNEKISGPEDVNSYKPQNKESK